MILPMVGMSAKDLFPFREVNKKWNIGIMGGYAGYGKNISSGAIGLNLTIKGFYADFIGWPGNHSKDMGVDSWSDKTCIAAHFGYQIPIVKSLRFIPIIGYAKVASGTTDGSHYNISSSGTVHNSFSEDKRISGLDFGGVAVINWKMININLAVTRYAIFGGIGIEF